MPSAMSRARRGLVATGALLLAAACGDPVDPPGQGVRAPVTITATLTPAQQALVAGMSVEVTGTGIGTPILATLSVSGATVNGTVSVPVGASRTFTVRAFDAQGRETYNGSATADVVAGTNPPLTVRLAALEGNVPIDVTIGTYGVTLTPATASVAVAGTVTLTAGVTTNGASVAGPLTWGVVNPTLVTLTVASDGRSAVVRGTLAGTTRVVASYEGVAATSTITVTPAANQPPLANANGPYTGTAGVAISFFSTGSTDNDGTIVSWSWAFGDGTTSTQANPQKVYASAGTFTATLTVTDDDGATATSSTSVTVSAPPPPVPLTFERVDVGTSHSCGLATTTGDVWCWGDNTYGQLGDGTTTSSTRPVRVLLPAPNGTRSLQLGANFSCANETSGRVYCWGDNRFGQLADGTTTSRSTPVLFPGLFTRLRAGQEHACAFSNVQLHCWGQNPDGRVGVGSPLVVTTPTAVPFSGTFDEVAPGGRHTCAIQDRTYVWCWGMNDSLQLGNASHGNATAAPARVTFPVTTQPITLFGIVAGEAYTCLLAGTNSRMWCWGANEHGQQSNGATSGTAFSSQGYTFNYLDAGYETACGNSAAYIYCWGRNDAGQIGDGTTTQRTAPVAAGGPTYPAPISAGRTHSCGVKNGTAYCWGDNSRGQLGDGTTTSRLTPAAVVTTTP